jgi:CPA1 family monovalent cation:H+ antiporter
MNSLDLLDLAAVIVGLAALLGYLNHRLCRLPPSTGILALALAGSLLLIGLNALWPGWGWQKNVALFLGQVDFTDAVMRGMLCFLVFAGALGIDGASLKANGGTVALLATVGVLISTLVIGALAYAVFSWLKLGVPLLVCLVLGALISPTDPVAVIALLKSLKAPRDLETQIAGEALFNDGVGLVVFLAFLSVAGLGGENAHLTLSVGSLASFFLWQTGGGAVLGLALGWLALCALKSIDYHPLELIITLALVLLTYSLSFYFRVSGLIAVVVAGILIGGYGRRTAMSRKTVEHLDAFWEMIDEILNSALFLLLGLEVLVLAWTWPLFMAGLLMIPITLAARGLSVALPLGLLRLGRTFPFPRGIVPILTWGGLRGAISVAMVLSLPRFPAKDLLVSCTYLIMLFSILVQGLTMKGLLVHYRIGQPPQKD